jgi:hypothetical protein
MGYFEPLAQKEKAEASTQWSWIESQMAASKADYLLVGGHYPVYSVCEHGPTSSLVANLKPLLEQYGGHYFAGHDHCMEHLAENNVQYIVTGMGEECCYANSNMKKVPNGTKQKNNISFFPSCIDTLC